jgi:malonyl-CoA decarboxylase
VFVEIALTMGIACELAPLLDAHAPELDPDHADTAVFYSISNCQPGLRGVNLGPR